MGYQESFIKFNDTNTLKLELRKYGKRDKSKDFAEIVCVDRVKRDIFPFKVGDLVAVVCGERSEQSDRNCLRQGLGIKNVNEIVFIDNPFYHEMAWEQDCDLGSILSDHFERLTDAEYKKLISVKKPTKKTSSKSSKH